MPALIFHSPASLEEALELGARHGPRGRFLAGGTDLMVSLRRDGPPPDPLHVTDLSRLAQLRAIEPTDNGLRIGACVTHAEVVAQAGSGALGAACAAILAAACGSVGSPQIRNRATVGGNLCNASPCADSAPALLALDAVLILRSVRGSREIALDAAFEAPYRLAKAPDEILTHIRIPPVPAQTRGAFVKLGRRNALAVSRMSIAVALRQDADGLLSGSRVAAGSVAPTPRRFPEVEALLDGATPGQVLFEQAGRRLADRMVSLTGRRWSTPYKEPVVAALTARGLAQTGIGA